MDFQEPSCWIDTVGLFSDGKIVWRKMVSYICVPRPHYCPLAGAGMWKEWCEKPVVKVSSFSSNGHIVRTWPRALQRVAPVRSPETSLSFAVRWTQHRTGGPGNCRPGELQARGTAGPGNCRPASGRADLEGDPGEGESCKTWREFWIWYSGSHWRIHTREVTLSGLFMNRIA